MRMKVTILSLIPFALIPGCTSTPPPNPPASSIAGDQSVHCLLPPRVQKLGNITYPARRQLVFESATRCTLRGGEYTVYDRSTAQSSAEFYHALADSGDAEAQYSLGLVYEALFNPARYEDAAAWYRKAADQGHNNAMKNLSYLYEQGLGVQKDRLAAINLLRQSGGITDDLVLTSELDAVLSEADSEIRRLTKVLERQNNETSRLQADLAIANADVEERKRELIATRSNLARFEEQIVALQSTQAQSAPAPAPESSEELDRLRRESMITERLAEEQELIIASLEADLSAQAAQLAASEQKAKLQDERLTERLANAQRVADRSAQDALAAIRAKDEEISALGSELEQVRDSLRTQHTEHAELLAELESSRERIETGAEASQRLTTLLAELDEREATIAQQTERIAALQNRSTQASVTEAEVLTLRTQLAGLNEELAAQRSGYARLQQELESGRVRAQEGEAAAQEIDKLLVEVARRGDVITFQTQRIGKLEEQAARAGEAIDKLQKSSEQRVGELNYVQAQLVQTESELVRTRSSLVQAQVALAAEEQAVVELERTKRRLENQLSAAADSNTSRLRDLERQLSATNSELQSQTDRIQELSTQVAQREAELAAAQQERTQTLAMRSSVPQLVFPSTPDIELPPGNKYALIIGNDDYEFLNDLTTAEVGARTVAEILRNRYDFEIELLTNASQREIMGAFSALQRKLTDDDYVLIYYAGHGERNPKDPQESYWLPIDARPDTGSSEVIETSFEADGIKSQWITEEIRAMKARHVMIIADSCYAGATVRTPQVSIPYENLPRERLQGMMENMVMERSRTVLTSGGDRPVLDESIDGPHSVFTQALVEILERNPGIIFGQSLHAQLVEQVRYNAQQLDFTQVPSFSEVAGADHGNGQFMLKSI